MLGILEQVLATLIAFIIIAIFVSNWFWEWIIRKLESLGKLIEKFIQFLRKFLSKRK